MIMPTTTDHKKMSIEDMLEFVQCQDESLFDSIYEYGFFNLNKLVEISEKHFNAVRITNGAHDYYFMSNN